MKFLSLIPLLKRVSHFFAWQTDYHLHCREWDDLLNGGQWEPERITEKLPEFFRFVKKVHGFVYHEMKETASSTRTSKPMSSIIAELVATGLNHHHLSQR